MTRQGWTDWADKKVHTEQCRGNETVYDCEARLLRNEHRRAVRVVKRQLGLYQRQREVEKDKCTRDLLAGSILACVELLESLQRGRE